MFGFGLTAAVSQAFNRFGLGGRPDDVIPNDAVAWLTSQLSGTDPIIGTGPTQSNCLQIVNNFQVAPAHSAQQAAARLALNNLLANEQVAYVQAAISTTTPFHERLVWFWTNHFAVQQASGVIAEGCAGDFVRSAIRPFVNDTFVNMLLAVMQHPAMLDSLNNDVSVGPQSPHGQGSGAGINENLSRETLELFTVGLGVGGTNFTQADVDALAYMLTGWTVSTVNPSQGFVIAESWHQPGPQTMLGQTYPGSVFDAFEALEFLGTHPQTYLHIATKMVAHFCSDSPADSEVQAVVNALTASGGSLSAAAQAIIALPRAWDVQTKLRTPQDFILAASRAVAAPNYDTKSAMLDIALLGQPVWSPPFPNGWSDMGSDWASPAQMMLRTNWTNTFCNGFKNTDPVLTVTTALGPLISPQTTAMLSRISATHDKLTVLFCSPEFQRR